MEPEEKPARHRRRRSRRDERREERKRETLPARLTRVATWVVSLLLLAVLLAGSYLIGRKSGSEPAAAPSRQAAANEQPGGESDRAAERAAVELTDDYIKARNEDRARDALELIERIGRTDPSLPGWRLERARMLAKLNRQNEAFATLADAVRQGEAEGAALMLEAELTSTSGGAPHIAERAWKEAIAAAPFSFEPYFNMGETLRAQGKAAEAASFFRKSLLRAHRQSEEFIIRMKLMLSQVEAGDEELLRQSLPAALARAPVPSEALIAAAARAVLTDDLEAAKRHLSAARAQLQPEFYHWIIRDPLWNLYRDRPELRDLLGPPSPPPSEPADQ